MVFCLVGFFGGGGSKQLQSMFCHFVISIGH